MQKRELIMLDDLLEKFTDHYGKSELTKETIHEVRVILNWFPSSDKKTGIELIAVERKEQIEKHGKTHVKDILENSNGQMIKAAHELLHKHPGNMGFPAEWDRAVVHRMASKNLRERLIIAGALIAAELDRIENTKDM